jgi:hypothetical protein
MIHTTTSQSGSHIIQPSKDQTTYYTFTVQLQRLVPLSLFLYLSPYKESHTFIPYNSVAFREKFSLILHKNVSFADGMYSTEHPVVDMTCLGTLYLPRKWRRDPVNSRSISNITFLPMNLGQSVSEIADELAAVARLDFLR